MTLLDLLDTIPERTSQPLEPENPVATEIHRRDSNYQKVLDRLRRGPATNHELVAIGGYRFGGRIYEMRKNGINIPDPENLGGGTFLYTLKDDNDAL